MLRSIHSGLSEQEGSVSGPISLLCLLLSSDGELILTPYSNIGHSSFIFSLIISCLSIWAQTESKSHLTHGLENTWHMRSLQFFVLFNFSFLVNIDSLSLSFLSLSVAVWRGVSDYQKWDREKHDRWNENHVLTINPCFSTKTIKKFNITKWYASKRLALILCGVRLKIRKKSFRSGLKLTKSDKDLTNDWQL